MVESGRLPDLVIPVRLKSIEEDYQVYSSMRQNDPVVVKIKPHGVALAFAMMTIQKMQGQTCINRLILDLNKRPFKPPITYHGLYVALSRVRNRENIR